MSKIGKKPIEIPAGVTLTVDGLKISSTGPKGNLEIKITNHVKVIVEDNLVKVESKDESTQYVGLYRTLINNLIVGVSQGFKKELEFHGIGYKASVQNGDLLLNMGYSHPVTISKLDGIEYAVNDNVITVSGIDKVLVGDIAAKIRAVRKPEPYKGKGIRYKGERIIRKESKSSA